MNLKMSNLLALGGNLMNWIRSPGWQQMDLTNYLFLKIAICL